MDDSLIIEIWDTFKEYIPDKSKEIAANQFVDFLVGKDVDLGTLEGLKGYDPYLDDAVELVVEEFKSLDGEEDEGYEEDEDH